jgi:hypothetical protein
LDRQVVAGVLAGWDCGVDAFAEELGEAGRFGGQVLGPADDVEVRVLLLGVVDLGVDPGAVALVGDLDRGGLRGSAPESSSPRCQYLQLDTR